DALPIYRHRQPALGAVAHLGDVRDDLLEGRVAEGVELHLDDRAEPLHRQADREAGDPGLGQRGVEAALLAEVAGEPVGDPEDAAEAADVLAEDQDVLVGGEGVAQGPVERPGEGDLAHRVASVILSSSRTISACSRSCGVGSASTCSNRSIGSTSGSALILVRRSAAKSSARSRASCTMASVSAPWAVR